MIEQGASRGLLVCALAVGSTVMTACGASDATSRGVSAEVDASTASRALPRPEFDRDGALVRPVRYREWIYIGTPLTPNSLNPPEAPFPDFHPVYIHPEDYAAYSETGVFPQGTVIVKELVSVGAEAAVSGRGFFMGDFIGLEAAIKDAGRFPDEPGNWAYFTFGHSYPLSETAVAAPVGECNVCHAAAAQEDYVFTQYYPVLRAARPSQPR